MAKAVEAIPDLATLPALYNTFYEDLYTAQNNMAESHSGLEIRVDKLTDTIAASQSGLEIRVDRLATKIAESQHGLGELTSAMDKSQSSLEIRVNALTAKLDQLEPRAEELISRFLLSVERAERTIDESNIKLQQAYGGIFDRQYLGPVVMAVSVSLWLGRDSWRAFVGVIGVFGKPLSRLRVRGGL